MNLQLPRQKRAVFLDAGLHAHANAVAGQRGETLIDAQNKLHRAASRAGQTDGQRFDFRIALAAVRSADERNLYLNVRQGTRKISANSLRTRNGCCVADQTAIFPLVVSARTTYGSMA